MLVGLWPEAPAHGLGGGGSPGLFSSTWLLHILLTLQTNKPKIFRVLWLKGKTSQQRPSSNSMLISQACPEQLGRGHHPSPGSYRGDKGPALPAGQRCGLRLSKQGVGTSPVSPHG